MRTLNIYLGSVIALLFLWEGSALAQSARPRPKTIEDSAWVATDNLSIFQAQQLCFDQARKNALIGEFGEIRTSQLVRLVNGEKDSLQRIELSIPQGRWLSTTKEEVVYVKALDKKNRGGNYAVSCKVRGKGVAHDNNPNGVQLKLLTAPSSDKVAPSRGIGPDNRLYFLSNGQYLYLSLKNNRNAYVTIFQTDFKRAYRLFPYPRLRGVDEPDSCYRYQIQRQKEYIFFSPQHNEFPAIRNYEVEKLRQEVPPHGPDLNKMYVIISEECLDEIPLFDSYEYGKYPYLDYARFVEWLEGRKASSGISIKVETFYFSVSP